VIVAHFQLEKPMPGQAWVVEAAVKWTIAWALSHFQ